MKNGFKLCANNYIYCLRDEKRYSTAHVYENAINSLARFFNHNNITFDLINKDNLRKYEQFLKNRKCKPNTISTYMRMIRAIYNKGVEAGNATYIPQLFREVFTGVESLKKKSLPPEELQILLTGDVENVELRKTQILVNLMFVFCGMPFVDLAHLGKENIKSKILEYQRRKTGTPIKIEVLNSAQEKIAQITSKNNPKYLFSLLSGTKQGKEAHTEYQTALCKFNRDLKLLAKELGISQHVTSYSIRHSFATSLKNQKVPIEMISELLGHKSIKTTQIYLKSFALEEHTKINKLNYKYVCNYVGMSQNKSKSKKGCAVTQ